MRRQILNLVRLPFSPHSHGVPGGARTRTTLRSRRSDFHQFAHRDKMSGFNDGRLCLGAQTNVDRKSVAQQQEGARVRHVQVYSRWLGACLEYICRPDTQGFVQGLLLWRKRSVHFLLFLKRPHERSHETNLLQRRDSVLHQLQHYLKGRRLSVTRRRNTSFSRSCWA